MRRKREWLVWLCGLFPVAVSAIPIENLRGEAYSDIGQLVRGNDDGQDVKGHYLNRLGATLHATDTLGGKLVLRAGLGGIFWQTFPHGDFWHNTIKFGPGITEARAEYFFTPRLSAEGGYFPFKYSPALNLGEYLLRSESYPTYIATGGWTWVDSAHMRAMGARAQALHFGGAFRHQLGVYWEFENPPLYDMTPAYLFAWRPVEWVEIGGGGALRHWVTGDLKSPGSILVDSAGKPLGESATAADSQKAEKITRRAVNVMARANLDLSGMLNLPEAGPFRIYAEGAILGVRNQPVYYQDVSNRMPVMVGLHLPVFGFLDLLAVEAEYLGNPWPDSRQILDGGKLAGTVASDLPLPNVEDASAPAVHGDDWKWSVHAVRTLVPGVSLKLQIANDHLRLQNFSTSGILQSSTPQTVQRGQWYYLVRLQWGF